VISFIEKQKSIAREQGYVETLFGRRRYLPDIHSHNSVVRSFAERNAVNAPIQGTSADIIKLAMIRVDERLREEGLRTKMVLQIHDELLFDTLPEEVDRVKEIVVDTMENIVKLSVPLTVECNSGKSWLEAH
jgi:DNA polymerase-1